jgi:hypothetical protein
MDVSVISSLEGGKYIGGRGSARADLGVTDGRGFRDRF